MADDPWASFNPQPAAATAAPAPQGDPWAAFKPRMADMPQGSDAGASAAFAENALDHVPIVGPALERAGDYVGSHIGSWISGKPVDQVLAEGQARRAATLNAHPVASTAGGVVGGVMGTAPLVAAAPAAFGAETGGLTAGKVIAGAATGAALGAGDAAVRDGSVGEGALGGAVAGAAGPVIGAVGSRVGEAAADAIARSRALRTIGVGAPEAEILTRAAQNDGSLNGPGLANIRAAGPDAMLADAGPGIQNVLDTALQRGGAGAVAARQAIENRAANADGQITGALDQAFGAPQGVARAGDAIRTGSASARAQAYDAAYAQPIDYSTPTGQQLEAMVRNRVPAGIIARANNQMRIDGDQSQQILARLGNDGSVTYERLPDVRQLDYITRSLRDVSQRGDGQGALGGNTSEGRSYGNLAQDIRGSLRQAVPEYGAALDTAAQPIDARNALEFGSTMLSPSVPRDVAADTVRGMSQAEIGQVRAGVRSTIAETLANVRRTVTDPNIDARQAMGAVKDLSSDAAQEKIGLLLSPNEHTALRNSLASATRALELRAGVATNSRTFARTMTNDAVKDAAAPGPVGKLLQGEPLQAGKSAIQFATGNTPANVAAREDAIYGSLADIATRYRGQDAVDFLTRLQQAATSRAGTNSFTRQLPYSGIASTGLLSLLPALNQPR